MFNSVNPVTRLLLYVNRQLNPFNS
jgi:hypothetical protein